MKPSVHFRPLLAAFLAVAGVCSAMVEVLAADAPADRPYIPAEILARKTIIPDLPGGNALPKEEPKRKGEEKFTPLAPDSAVGSFIDAPMFQPRPGVRPNSTANVTPRIPLTREKREEADQKKNWIFLTPDSKAFTPEKILRVRTKDDVNELGEEREFKGAVQSFMEKGGAVRTESGRDEKTGRDGASDPGRSEALDRPGDRNSAIGWVNEGGLFDRRSGPSTMDPGSAAAFMRGTGAGEISTGFTLFGNGTGGTGSAGGFTGGTAGTGGNRAERTDNQKAWANDFNKMLNATGGSTPARGGDPLSLFNDSSRQPINPVVGSPSGSPFEAPKASGFEAYGKSPSFGEPAPTIFGNSSMSPSLFAPAPPLTAPKPGVLEIPKRKY